MSGPCVVMDWSLPRLKLLIWFLLPANNVCLHGNPVTGVDHNLHCVNDYLFTINCSLSIVPSENSSDSSSSYRLVFTEINELETFVCMLTNTNGDYFCSLKKSDLTPEDDEYYAITFSDTNIFKISLCHNQHDGSEICELLHGNYMPFTNIKPNPPCGLIVNHNSSQHHFTWEGTKDYGPFTGLTKNLKYQLQYFERGDKHNVIPREINTENMNYSVDDEIFTPDTEYAARVRSSPNQAFYKGQWSDWSGEVHWRMGSAVKSKSAKTDLLSNPFVSGQEVLVTLCVIMPFILLLCYALVKKWRQCAIIPTPAPYFNTLYSDCQGDFKSWVITQDKMGDMLKGEETLRIDRIIQCADIQEESQPQFQHQLMESTYRNLTDPGCDTSLLGIPYAVSTMAPQLTPGSSIKSLTLSSQPASPVEGDSGCWLCSHTSRERTPPFYYNEYCTLSTVPQTNLVKAPHHGRSTRFGPTGMISGDSVTDI